MKMMNNLLVEKVMISKQMMLKGTIKMFWFYLRIYRKKYTLVEFLFF